MLLRTSQVWTAGRRIGDGHELKSTALQWVLLATAAFGVAAAGSARADDPIRKGDSVVTTEECDLRVGDETLATVPAKTRLVAVDVKDDWVAVVVERDGQKVSGWIQSRHLARVSNAATGDQREEGPTPGLFQKLLLIQYKFGARRQDQPKIFGADMIGVFSAFSKGGGLELTARIPDVDGQLKYRGLLMGMSTLDVNGNVVSSAGSNGYVWTARVEKIGELDLGAEGKVTQLPGFDFDSFSKTEGVVAFANGYAVNLFGAIIEDKSIVKAGSKKTYLNGQGKKLCGRIISKVERNGKSIIEERILK
jgi:hypothetical protein